MSVKLIQMKTCSRSIDGMAYVLRMEEGELVVIDGGAGDGDAELLIQLLKQESATSVPEVDLWILTHAHPDHTFACMDMAKRFSDQIKVKRIAYHFPSEEYFNATEPFCLKEVQWLEESLPRFGDYQRLTPRRGDTYSWGEAKLEVLYSWEDLPEHPFVAPGLNDSSLVLRLLCKGQSVLFLADAQIAAGEALIALYGNSLKSKVCQVAHHGCDAVSSEVYSVIDPEILLWPASEKCFQQYLLRSGVNRRLVFEQGVKELILAGHGTRELVFPANPSSDAWLPPFPETKQKDLVPDFVIPLALNAPSLEDPQSPSWQNALLLPLDHVQSRSADAAEGDCALLYTKEALYLKLRMNKEHLPENPEHISTLDSNCFRVYLTEQPVRDYSVLWEQMKGREGAFSDLKLYFSPKSIQGRPVVNNKPEMCESVVYPTKSGVCICARIHFAFPHFPGDLLGIVVEGNAVDSLDGKRVLWMSFVKGEDSAVFYTNPAALSLGQLGS